MLRFQARPAPGFWIYLHRRFPAGCHVHAGVDMLGAANEPCLRERRHGPLAPVIRLFQGQTIFL